MSMTPTPSAGVAVERFTAVLTDLTSGGNPIDVATRHQIPLATVHLVARTAFRLGYKPWHDEPAGKSVETSNKGLLPVLRQDLIDELFSPRAPLQPPAPTGQVEHSGFRGRLTRWLSLLR